MNRNCVDNKEVKRTCPVCQKRNWVIMEGKYNGLFRAHVNTEGAICTGSRMNYQSLMTTIRTAELIIYQV